MSTLIKRIAIIGTVFFAMGCAAPTRMGMVKDQETGLQLGSTIEKNFFIDASQFKNRSIKVSTRNSSGDGLYQVTTFSNEINSIFSGKGYQPTQDDSFGIKLDVNVLYSGQIQSNMQTQFAFLGGAAGGIAGNVSRTTAGTATGLLVGATVGSIIGSYVTNDTYIVIAEVSLGITDAVISSNSDKKIITFSSSRQLQEEKLESNYTPFRQVIRTKIAVYAGGRNTTQQQIANQVRRRLISIVSDSI